MSLGTSLNNPFDLRPAETWRWQGEIQATTGINGEGLCKFDTLENGCRAGFKDLFNAWKFDGLSTLMKLAYHYAPPNENDTPAYLAGLVSSTGWGVSAPIDLSAPDRLLRCGRAFLIQEQGQGYVETLDPVMLDRAVAAALA